MIKQSVTTQKGTSFFAFQEQPARAVGSGHLRREQEHRQLLLQPAAPNSGREVPDGRARHEPQEHELRGERRRVRPVLR